MPVHAKVAGVVIHLPTALALAGVATRNLATNSLVISSHLIKAKVVITANRTIVNQTIASQAGALAHQAIVVAEEFLQGAVVATQVVADAVHDSFF